MIFKKFANYVVLGKNICSQYIRKTNMADNELIRKVYDDAKVAFGSEQLNASTVITLSVRLMELVEKLPNIDGPEKKRIVIEVAKMIVNDSDLSDEDKANVNLIIDLTLPMVIDSIISASRGQFTLNSLKNKLKKLCC